ncbi:zinc-binding protein A33-like [Conger conger]|uniref:zinc-binding protein A33-like n=1 Tax=Conger conger TaxID=82655 RepID=UPI002A598CB3|nr:zinc-binding protein A33-like [Conger conger]
MAEKSLLKFLCCHVCSEIFKDPVSLHCNHSFCKICIHRFWEKKNTRNCPVCNRRSSMPQPDVNFSLKVLADSFVQRKESGAGSGGAMERVTMCNKHTERPRWFCVDDKMALCALCESPEHHSTHNIISTEEAVSDLKGKLKSSLKPVQDQLIKCQKFNTQYEKIVQCTKKQVLATEKQIKAEFEKLHQFLREEEEARLAALREEEKLKGKIIIEELKKIQDQITSLSDSISNVEQELKEQDMPFFKTMHRKVITMNSDIHFKITAFLSFQKYSQTSVRAQCTLRDPELLSGALINVAKHLGNLKFRVCEKMLGMVQYTPVTLDPNSAHPKLSLSDDLTSVRYANVTLPLPDNPERFSYCVNVLGSEGFTSGKHSWEVDVKDKPQWTIGVAKESIGRKGQVTCSPAKGYWVLLLRDGDQCYSASGTLLTLERKPHRIRVELDYDRGEVSFFDPSDMSHIYTFVDTFTERVFPYISPCGNEDGRLAGSQYHGNKEQGKIVS